MASFRSGSSIISKNIGSGTERRVVRPVPRESLKLLHLTAEALDSERSVYENRLAAVEALEARRLQLQKLLVKFPQWQKDSDAKTCNACKKAFGLFVRRHHCRRCGKIFCSKCSNTTKNLEELGYKEPVRHCIKCFSSPAVNADMVKHELALLDKIRTKERKTVANPTGDRILGLLGYYRKCLSQVETKQGKSVILNSINCFMEMPNVKKLLDEANVSDDDMESKAPGYDI